MQKKARPQTVMPRNQMFLQQPTLAEGGYCAFMDKIIKKMIISKTAKSNFFAISIMLTFHKHLSMQKCQCISFITGVLTPQSHLKTCHRHLFYGVTFHSLKKVLRKCKGGITAGENTVKKSCFEYIIAYFGEKSKREFLKDKYVRIWGRACFCTFAIWRVAIWGLGTFL